jgi:NADH-quinone oxidoreductase subunit J
MTETGPSAAEAAVFWVCAVLSVTGGLGLILSRRAVHSALWVALTMISLAVLYLANAAPFLGMVQIIVYTGAVMMLFLFVLMVVGVDSSDSLVETLRGQRVVGILLSVGFGILLVLAIGTALSGVPAVGLDAANAEYGGNVEGIARLLFGEYLLAFEIVAGLLITAALGALVLAHRERWQPRRTQRQLSEERVRSGDQMVPLPAPGVYARHNAVDTPALLPDGSVAEISVPGPLRARGDLRPVDAAAVAETEVLASGRAALGPADHPVADDPGTSPGEPR